MTPETQILDWLARHEGAMTDLLRALVDVDSGTADKAGVDAAGAVLIRFWREHGLDVSVQPVAVHGDIIRADLPGPAHADPRPVLLLGHRDTVFPPGEAARRPFRVENGRGYGPGVADMKAGLVIEAFVMAAFAACGAPLALRMLTTSDEEIASPSCAPAISAAARAARAVFNAEPSRRRSGAAAGNRATQVVTRGRKGGVFLRLEATGKAAHSGAHYDRGRSAILDLAQKVAPLHALTDLAAGVSVNVGLIGGGQTVNTIAPHAWAEIDLRYVEPAQRDEMIGRIRAIALAPAVEGVTAELTVSGEFLPLVQTPEGQHLLDLYTAAAARLGVEVTAEFTGGCADSGLTAAAGCPTLCSIGPCGGGGHTPEEWVEMDSILPAAQTLALTLLALARDEAGRSAPSSGPA
ncbi:MAG: M20/M25/M40 family metallo-hydrolase [Gemmobacter sp.]